MNTKEDKELFLKVDSVEPVFKGGGNWPGEPYLDGVKVWINGDGHFFPCDQYTVCNPDKVREGGLQQVLELMKELVKMSPSVNKKLFGYSVIYDIITRIPYEETVEKLDNWKKDKEKIRVRDEVYSQNCQTRFVITRIFAPYGWEDRSACGRSGCVFGGVRMNRKGILEAASKAVHAEDVDHDYGKPEDNFATIAELWNAYLEAVCDDPDIYLSSRDVAAMMILLKVARVATSEKADHWVDIAGYAACGGEVDGEPDEKNP